MLLPSSMGPERGLLVEMVRWIVGNEGQMIDDIIHMLNHVDGMLTDGNQSC